LQFENDSLWVVGSPGTFITKHRDELWEISEYLMDVLGTIQFDEQGTESRFTLRQYPDDDCVRVIAFITTPHKAIVFEEYIDKSWVFYDITTSTSFLISNEEEFRKNDSRAVMANFTLVSDDLLRIQSADGLIELHLDNSHEEFTRLAAVYINADTVIHDLDKLSEARLAAFYNNKVIMFTEAEPSIFIDFPPSDFEYCLETRNVSVPRYDNIISFSPYKDGYLYQSFTIKKRFYFPE
jgi:hypothetical protein